MKTNPERMAESLARIEALLAEILARLPEPVKAAPPEPVKTLGAKRKADA
jgi:hypothetical protein